MTNYKQMYQENNTTDLHWNFSLAHVLPKTIEGGGVYAAQH